jgi:thiosulfate dehydrogenase
VVIGFFIIAFHSCLSSAGEAKSVVIQDEQYISVDTSLIGGDKFGDAVRYGRELMINTAYYIGPKGTKGSYLGNIMNCTNCHQDAGTKPFSFNLMATHDNYPQYRAREGKILTLAERVNNCVMRPHNGKPLPLDGEEMVAFLSYFKWINGFVPKGKPFKGGKNMSVEFPATAASSERGKILYDLNCVRCHGKDGEGQLNADKTTYVYPPLWGASGYQPGSSMHRVIKQAQWLKANMPYDKVMVNKPFLTDEEALDIAAYVNNDELHKRPDPKTFDYPHVEEKAIDYDRAPFADTFSVAQHKFGPYQPIIDYWKKQGKKPSY